jgi:DNA-binding NarL/FixJ family response regulator
VGIRVLLADDHKIVREGLRTLLHGKPGIDVIAEADNGRIALQMCREAAPDVIVMDITMPDLNGIEAARQLIVAQPDIKVIALSMHSDHRLVTEMFNAGAVGYLLKDCAFEELEAAIYAVMKSQFYMSPTIAKGVMEYYKRLDSQRDKTNVFAVLTAREREVLQLLAEGMNTKQSAFHLHVSPKTIETHRRRLMKKLRVTSLAELTKYAIREGLTGIED